MAVAARDTRRTAEFAAEFGVENMYASSEELVGDAAVDVVYVATPHSAHREIALQAIAAGKHLLVEKPLALSAAEGREIATAARRAGVFVMEAMWTRYLPQMDIVRQLVADGTLGEIHLVMADFGFVAPQDPSSRMWDPRLGGGALLDAGVYPVSFASSILGTPARVQASGIVTPTGVDLRSAAILTSAGGAQAIVATSMVSKLPTRATVIGSAARVEISSPFFSPTGLTLIASTDGEDASETWTDDTFTDAYDGLSHQAIALASYVGEGRLESPIHSLDETIAVLATIEDIRAQLTVVTTES